MGTWRQLVWYVRFSGEQLGPFKFDELSGFLEQLGSVDSVTVKREGEHGWSSIESYEELAQLYANLTRTAAEQAAGDEDQTLMSTDMPPEMLEEFRALLDADEPRNSEASENSGDEEIEEPPATSSMSAEKLKITRPIKLDNISNFATDEHASAGPETKSFSDSKPDLGDLSEPVTVDVSLDGIMSAWSEEAPIQDQPVSGQPSKVDRGPPGLLPRIETPPDTLHEPSFPFSEQLGLKGEDPKTLASSGTARPRPGEASTAHLKRSSAEHVTQTRTMRPHNPTIRSKPKFDWLKFLVTTVTVASVVGGGGVYALSSQLARTHEGTPNSATAVTGKEVQRKMTLKEKEGDGNAQQIASPKNEPETPNASTKIIEFSESDADEKRSGSKPESNQVNAKNEKESSGVKIIDSQPTGKTNSAPVQLKNSAKRGTSRQNLSNKTKQSTKRYRVPQRLSRRMIERTLKRSASQLAKCGAAKNTKVTAVLDILSSGKVKRLEVADFGRLGPSSKTCVEKVLKKTKFPAAKRPSNGLRIPLRL